VEIAWTGPDNNRDYIAIAEVGAPDGSYLTYQRTNRGSPLTLNAPDALGTYEVRYVLGESGRAIAVQTITLVPVEATLEPLNAIVPGGEVQIAWTGPDYSRDYIAITEAGAPEGHYLHYTRTNRGNPLVLQVPEALGNFELRYVIGESGRTLASLPITIQPASVTLTAPPSVAANGTLEVTWTGPGNWEDFIEIVPAGSPADAAPVREARTSQGNPLPIFAPAQAGDYEIRYKMRDTGEVVATVPLTVE
jgi:Ca-activated chloride channel family protein